MDLRDAGDASSNTGRRVALRPSEWPPLDQDAWARATRRGGFLDEDGDAAAWRPASRRSAIGAWGRYLAYLRQHGLLDPDQGPAARVRPEFVGAYVRHLQARCGSTTVASYLGVLEMMIRALAPGEDWTWLRRLQARLQRNAVPSRDKRRRVVPADDLLRLGMELMEAAEAMAADAPLKAALGYRDGLMIALLAMRPLRQRNFLGMEIGRHLLPCGDGFRLRFDADETKTGQPLDVSVPVGLVAALRRYLDHHRPFLLHLRTTRGRSRQSRSPPSGAAVWLTQYGAPCGPSAQRAALEKHTVARYGHLVNAHLFRDCAATTVAHRDP
ncbi:hypothetical protein, partial [Acidisphaera rubrifaciens]|uniref:hypothetical protein n=1 Tax=Acidisphaera rubrifaciens TaxID=50715 RepID=UPI0006623E48